MPDPNEYPKPPKASGAAPWEVAARNQAPVPAQAAPYHGSGPQQSPRAKLVAIVGGALVVLLIGGGLAIKLFNASLESDKEQATSQDATQLAKEREAGEAMLKELARYLRDEYLRARADELRVVREFDEACKTGRFNTEYFTITGVGLLGGRGAGAYDFELVAWPQPANVGRAACYMAFRWDSEKFQISWH